MKNMILRAKAEENGVCLWEIAEAIGITDSTFSRRLRHELSAAERERLLKIVDEIAAQRKEG